METKYLNASKKGGVYEIKNKITNQMYIGSTNGFQKRFHEHLRKLRNNSHENFHLQKAWNKYGEESFIFSVLLVLEVNELDQRLVYEQKYLNQYWKLGVLYNMVPLTEPKDLLVSGYGRKKTDEERKKISLARKGMRQHKQRNWSTQVQTLVDAFRNDTEIPNIGCLSEEEKLQCREAYDKWTAGGEYASDHIRRKKAFKQWMVEKNYFFDKRQNSWTKKSITDQEAALKILEKYRKMQQNSKDKTVKRA